MSQWTVLVLVGFGVYATLCHAVVIVPLLLFSAVHGGLGVEVGDVRFFNGPRKGKKVYARVISVDRVWWVFGYVEFELGGETPSGPDFLGIGERERMPIHQFLTLYAHRLRLDSWTVPPS